MRYLILLCTFIIILKPSISYCQTNAADKNTLAVVTFVNDNIQERSARILIQSIRKYAGQYKDSKIYIILGDHENFPCTSLAGKNVFILPLDMDPGLRTIPLAYKAFAAAQVEKIVKDEVSTVAWFDPSTLVLNPLDELDLKNKYNVSIRPVSLQNTIGIDPGIEPNDYWAPIYNELGLDYKKVPAYETVVDEKPIQAYFNCEVFSVNPRLGIFKQWAEVLTKFIKDADYQNNVCNTFLRQLFLHQAVLSAVIISKVSPKDIKPLSIKTGYPFGQHEQLADKKKEKKLNSLSAVIMDYRWDRNGSWMKKIPVKGKLKEELADIYLDYCRLADNLYRIEGQCNSYLITTPDGSVLIDPAGAADAPQYFKQILEKHPLKAVLLTHAHQDHWDKMEVWQTDADIPIIAQREFNSYNEYRARLEEFYARRGAVYRRQPMPDTTFVPSFNPVKPTITFIDDYTYELGGFHFKMVHTPGETPDHTTIYIPELNAVFMGDNYYEYFINNATLRGTSTRPVLGYIKALDLALSYGPQFFLMGHGKPIVTKNKIKETVTNFRDALSYLNNETIKGINEGKDVYTLMNEIKIPDKYGLRPYFGEVPWTIRGIYHENIGWFDENPASIYSVPASSIYKDLAETAGIDKLVKKAGSLFENKKYVKVLHITDIISSADPENKAVNEIRLKALEALKAGTYNYQKRVWLDHAIRTVRELNTDK